MAVPAAVFEIFFLFSLASHKTKYRKLKLFQTKEIINTCELQERQPIGDRQMGITTMAARNDHIKKELFWCAFYGFDVINVHLFWAEDRKPKWNEMELRQKSKRIKE